MDFLGCHDREPVLPKTAALPKLLPVDLKIERTASNAKMAASAFDVIESQNGCFQKIGIPQNG